MSEIEENNPSTGYEIAVIGMAARFPGAESIERFWEIVKNGEEPVRFFTDRELTDAGVSPQLLENPNYVKAKAVLDDVDCFDASFFDYTLREAEIMDPQLRILHECSWKALENAGYNPVTYTGFIGFYVGAGTHLYWLARMLDRAKKDPSEHFGAFSLNDGYAASTQVAYRLNLKGPAVTIQTACSTSLVGIHMACQALLSGECDMALAGGVSVKLPVKTGYMYQEGMVLSPDGHCRAFDAGAAGTVSGEGVGVVVLKPLENALEDRDYIYAVVKGTAVNNDGNRKVGYSAPSVKGQAEVIRIAQQAAGVEPESITYIEAHGTGTTLGDPVEIQALTRAFNTEKKNFCRIGTVKSNFGHLDAAAGAAGFIKTVLALQHKLIPPSLNFETPNPQIDFENSPFTVNTELREWKTNGAPLRAGVSSFGIGGTNAHVVLEEAPEIEREGTEEREDRLIVISAKTEAALERNTANLIDHFKINLLNPGNLENPVNPGSDFLDAVYTLQVGRRAFEWRRSLVCRDAGEGVELLSAGNSKKVNTHRVTGEDPPVIFMFSGLGSQYTDMGRGLYEHEPLFKEELDRCFELLPPGLKDLLYPPQEGGNNRSDRSYKTYRSYEEDLNRPETSQLVIFIFEYALAKLLMGWGVMPHAMIGYSFGEYTAACIAGVIGLEDALALIRRRGELIAGTPGGAMLSIPLPVGDVLPLLRDWPELSLAIDNGPSCIAAGPASAVDSFEHQMKEKRYMCMRVNASHALHSTLMRPILQEFEAKLREIPLTPPTIPYISNVTGTWITPAEAVDPGYWSRHLSHTVQFARGIEKLTELSPSLFLELGPGRDLSALVQRYMGDTRRVLNMVRPAQMDVTDTGYLLDRVGRLWTFGKEIDWNLYYEASSERRYRVPLPTYSFEKQRFAIEDGDKPPVNAESAPAPASAYERTQLPGDYEAPRDHMEREIAAAFRDIFGLDKIGIHDDFFELGGDSLKVITLVTSIHRQLDADVPMEAVFTRPTVESIAEYIREKTDKRAYAAIPAVEEEEYYPLTPTQQRVFILDRIEEKNMAYNMPSVLWMEGTPDIPRLEKACKQLMERHESLRTAFFLRDGEPVQKVVPPQNIDFVLEYSEEENAAAFAPIIDDFVQPFDLDRPPLWRVKIVKTGPDKYLLMQNIHHIVTDDISTGVMISELARLYRDESLAPLPVQYKDYAVWQKQAAAEGILETQKSFWLQRFSGELPLLEMPCDFPRPEIRSFRGAHIEAKIDVPLRDALAALAGKNRTTLFVLLFALYNTLLHTYTGQEDIVVGAPITGRSHRDVQEVVGMFVNTLALRNFPTGDKTFENFLREVRESTLEAFANQLYQFDDLVEQLNIRGDMSRNPLFDTMFVLHTVDLEKVDIPGVTIYPYEFDSPVAKFDITLNVADSKSGLNTILEFSTDLFKPGTAQRFMDDFIALVEIVTAGSPSTLTLEDIRRQLRKEEEEEKKRILEEFNNTDVDYPKDKTVIRLIEEQASRTPDRIALTRPALTYRELIRETLRTAHRLKDLGVTPGTVVALFTDRTPEMIAGMLAVLRAGGAYLPIDPEYPAERIRYMVRHTEVPVILTTGVEIPFAHTARVIDLTKREQPRIDPGAEPAGLPLSAGPTDLAYVIYTSGTTGVPKGVMIENRSVVNFIRGITGVVPFTTRDVILSLTTLGFDIFGLETLLPLTAGSRVVIGTMEEQSDPSLAAAAVQRETVTILQATPSRLKLFFSHPGAGEGLGQLKVLIVGGEVFPEPLLEQARELTRGKIYNVYGPTETTIWSTIKDVTGENELNIGKPMANTRVYIVDRNTRLLPPRVPGELCIAGHGTARGYWKDESLTAEKFVENPFIPVNQPGGEGFSRMYRTGDLAAWLPDGNIRFMGRLDHQVKIRGYRIEPGEIESRLNAHDAVRESVVLTRREEGNGGELYLCAYIVANGDIELEIPALRTFLSVELPDYMIPSDFVRVEGIPLTPNGKIDRAALSRTEGTRLKRGGAFTAPATEMEIAVARTWKEVLKVDNVGTGDNFFDLGGTSLKIIKVVSLLKSELNRDFPVVAMFRYPTVGALAQYLSGEGSAAAPRRRNRSGIKAKGRERAQMKASLKQNRGR